MRLTAVQKALWAAAGAAVLAWGGWLVLGDSASATDAQVEAFRPSFALSDAEGRTVASEDLRGRFLLVFFGFTNCPDVCPLTLAEVAQVMDALGSDASQVQPVFISIDPERDRALGLAEYAEAFHPSILPLAGDDSATQAAAESFKVFFEREDDVSASDGYTMSHSSGLFLVGPEGDWLRQYEFGTPAADILADLQPRI